MKTFGNFITGLIVGLLIAAAPVTALASTGHMTIEIDPISILVNGQLFQPTDANGKPVPTFQYQGTSYAPVRALAETYGLTVGYDAERNMATVDSTSAPAGTVTGFSSQWTVREKPVTNYGNEKIFTAVYSGSMTMDEFKSWWKNTPLETIKAETERIAAEAQSTVPGYTVTMYFSYDTYSLGTVHASDGYTGSNFDVARMWIK